jgi:hypothetical protein
MSRADLIALSPVQLRSLVALEPTRLIAGTELQAGLWIGHGIPGTIIGSHPQDEYVDLDTGDLYQLQ